MFARYKTTACAAVVLAGIPIPVQAQDFFPVQMNDSWVLADEYGQETSLQVTETVSSWANPWYRVRGFLDNDVWVQSTANKVHVWSDVNRQRQLLVDFGAAPGSQWAMDLRYGEPPYADPVRVVSTLDPGGLSVVNVLGTERTCATVYFQWEGLADAGVTRQVFCMGLGLREQERMTFAGPTVSRTVTYISQNTGLDIQLANTNIQGGDSLELTLVAWTAAPNGREFTSATSQQFEIGLFDRDGNEIRRWSDDQYFLQVFTTWTLQSEERFAASLPLTDQEGNALQPGRYRLEARLLNVNGLAPCAEHDLLVQ